MKGNILQVTFRSPLGGHLIDLIAERRAFGYKYIAKAAAYERFDRFLAESGLTDVCLPKDLALKWMENRPNERLATRLKRVRDVRQLALYLVSRGVDAYVPDLRQFPREKRDFHPRVLTQDEIKRILHMADSMPPFPASPLYHVVIPLVMRLLYGCGLRLSEALKLQMRNVELQSGVLRIREAKFGKERLVPMAPSLRRRIETFIAHHRSEAEGRDFLFPSPAGGHYANTTIGHHWRELLWRSGVPYEGREKGPRLHDLRHTFAVHRLAKWHAAGADLSVLLPVLSTYMGHVGMSGTQHYLHLVADMYPTMTATLERDHGNVIPRRAP